MLCTDMLVPQGHLLRKIDTAVDFKHIYEIVKELYCEDNGTQRNVRWFSGYTIS